MKFTSLNNSVKMDDNTDDVGVSVGTTLGALNRLTDFDEVAIKEGPRYTNPALFPNTVINSPASQVSIWDNIQGFNLPLRKVYRLPGAYVFPSINLEENITMPASSNLFLRKAGSENRLIFPLSVWGKQIGLCSTKFLREHNRRKLSPQAIFSLIPRGLAAGFPPRGRDRKTWISRIQDSSLILWGLALGRFIREISNSITADK